MVTDLSDILSNIRRCEYFSVESFGVFHKNEVSNDFFLIDYNIRSFHANFHTFDTFLGTLHKIPNFIILTETWNSNLTEKICLVNGYNGFHVNRKPL